MSFWGVLVVSLIFVLFLVSLFFGGGACGRFLVGSGGFTMVLWAFVLGVLEVSQGIRKRRSKSLSPGEPPMGVFFEGVGKKEEYKTMLSKCF